MADPIGIIAGVVGIATVAVQSSKALFELVDEVKGGPEGIISISRDARAFYAVVFSLNVVLKEEDIKDVVSSDKDMVEVIRNLKIPLRNCQVVLGELMVSIQKRLKPIQGSNGFQINANNVKWVIYAKSKVRELQARLEAAKSTLDSALGAVTALCSVRLVAMGKASVARQIKRSSAATDASFAIRRFVEESTINEAIATASDRHGVELSTAQRTHLPWPPVWTSTSALDRRRSIPDVNDGSHTPEDHGYGEGFRIHSISSHSSRVDPFPCDTFTPGEAQPPQNHDLDRFKDNDQHVAFSSVKTPSIHSENASIDSENMEIYPPEKGPFLCYICSHSGEVQGAKWREDRSEWKKHMLQHKKPFKCDQQFCKRARNGFSTKNDLVRHKKAVHRIAPRNEVINQTYVCAIKNCPHQYKLWIRADNFRQHCEQLHQRQGYDVDDLVMRGAEIMQGSWIGL